MIYVLLHMGNTKPFVQAACMCENILREPDNVASLIRIVDSFGIEAPPDIPGSTALLSLRGFIALRGGDIKGVYDIGLLLRRPDGTSGKRTNQTIEFVDGPSGVNIILNVNIDKPTAGLHWFDVLWGDEVLTSIPFELKFVKPEGQPVEAEASKTQPKSPA